MQSNAKERIKQAIHLICQTAHGLPLGAVRLSKILWFAEKEVFLSSFSPMLGVDFVKGPQGPYSPEAKSIWNELAREGQIRITYTTRGPYPFTLFENITPAKTNLLQDDEIVFLKNLTLEVCSEYTARSISDLTHNDVWRMLENGEAYPLHLVLAEHARTPTSAEIHSLVDGA